MTARRHFAAITMLTVAVLLVAYVLFGAEAAIRSETGAVERMSLVILLYAMALAVLLTRQIGARYWHLPALLGIFALRELDFHDWFFEPGLLHVGIFDAPVPLWQKAVSGLTMLLILVTLGRVVLLGTRPFLVGLWRRAQWSWALAGAGALAVLSVVFDETREAWFEATGVDYSWKSVMSIAEELAELGMALLIVLALLLALRPRKAG